MGSQKCQKNVNQISFWTFYLAIFNDKIKIWCNILLTFLTLLLTKKQKVLDKRRWRKSHTPTLVSFLASLGTSFLTDLIGKLKIFWTTFFDIFYDFFSIFSSFGSTFRRFSSTNWTIFGRFFWTFFTIFSPFFPLSSPLPDGFDRQIGKFFDDFFDFWHFLKKKVFFLKRKFFF